jgi:methyl-accepting chemotaxis protein
MKNKLEFKILSLIFGIIIISIFVSSAIVLYMVRSDMYSVAIDALEGTAAVVMVELEQTMLSGDPAVTKKVLSNLRTIEDSLETIEVLNHEGREAFKQYAPITEAETLRKLTSTGKDITVKKWDSLVFYVPLNNKSTCRACHGAEKNVLGAVKINMSLEGVKDKTTSFMLLVILGSLGMIIIMAVLFRSILRKFVISPIKILEGQAYKMAHGDLSFSTGIRTKDEIGRLDYSIKESLLSLSDILEKVKDVSGRVAKAADAVEKDSDKVVEGTQVEAESIANISSSVEQLNSAVIEVSDSTESLATSVEESAASIEEMASSISSVTKIAHELTGGIDETSTSIGEMSASIREIAKNAEELASVSEDALSAIAEIISSIKEVEGNARQSAELSDKVAEDASTLGVASVEKTMQGMQKIKTTVEKTAENVHKLGGRSEEIGKILTVIDEITDQTTLLALNAAILAAQAGEHGKGFSVVAGEIKDLAERTAFSTQEISELIQSVRQEVNEAVDAMSEGLKSVNEGFVLTREAGDALKLILDSSKKSSEMANSIKRSTAEQATSAKSVSEAMERVRNMVGQIASSTSEQSKGVSHIMQASDRMRDGAHQVDVATEQQAAGSRQISQSVDIISDRTQEISRAIYEQKVGAKQIWSAIEKIKNLPKENRDHAFKINNMIQELMKDSELIETELQKFILREDKTRAVIKLGIVPLEAPADMFKKFSGLAEYLSRELGKKVEIRVAPDYETSVSDLVQGVVHMSFMTPSTYIEAKHEPGVDVIGIALRDGKPYHHSMIIANKDSGIETLEDLKGKSFAFGNEYSTSSHLVPRAMLLDAGVDLADLSYFNYLGHHDAVIKAVLKGEFDAGAVTESVAKKFGDRGLNFIKMSDDIPEFNFCAGPRMGDADRNAVRTALFKLSDKTREGAAILLDIDKSYNGIQAASDTDFEGIRTIISNIGMQKK